MKTRHIDPISELQMRRAADALKRAKMESKLSRRYFAGTRCMARAWPDWNVPRRPQRLEVRIVFIEFTDCILFTLNKASVGVIGVHGKNREI